MLALQPWKYESAIFRLGFEMIDNFSFSFAWRIVQKLFRNHVAGNERKFILMFLFFLLLQEANSEGFANTDSVFTLAYAIIMLNVDQHNANVKQQKSMTVEVSPLFF